MPDPVITFVPMLLPLSTPSRLAVSRYAMIEVAMAFSMIVLITSLTPRVTLSHTAIPAHDAPTNMAQISVIATRRKPGRLVIQAAPASAAESMAAIRYCPSTPMFSRFILNPMATATAAR